MTPLGNDIPPPGPVGNGGIVSGLYWSTPDADGIAGEQAGVMLLKRSYPRRRRVLLLSRRLYF
jgi:hypothetical protein